MTTSHDWKNPSVLAFAAGDDPIAKMEKKVQDKVLEG